MYFIAGCYLPLGSVFGLDVCFSICLRGVLYSMWLLCILIVWLGWCTVGVRHLMRYVWGCFVTCLVLDLYVGLGCFVVVC